MEFLSDFFYPYRDWPACLLLCVLVFWIGEKILLFAPILKRLNLPTAVVGAICFLPFLRIAEYFSSSKITFPMELRDFLLVVFFCSIGLSVRFRQTLQGGKALLTLCALSILLVVFQNFVGVLVMISFDQHPLYGLLSGSIAYVGGFGSSLAWGNEFSKQGLDSALELGFACSTLGLLAGGLCAGPAAAWLIRRHSHAFPTQENSTPETLHFTSLPQPVIQRKRLAPKKLIFVLLWIGISVFVGDQLLPIFKSFDFSLPRFLFAMLIAILLVNIVRVKRFEPDEESSEHIGSWSFNGFIILSLLGMKFTGIDDLALPLLIIFALQILITILFATEVIFHAMGKDYESAVVVGGVVGFGLSSLAVAVATVKTITSNHGPAPKAIFLTSLVGAALIDLPNNILIGILTKLAFFQI